MATHEREKYAQAMDNACADCCTAPDSNTADKHRKRLKLIILAFTNAVESQAQKGAQEFSQGMRNACDICWEGGRSAMEVSARMTCGVRAGTDQDP